ncbi:MAG: glycosyltransferase family 2 protein [Anaerolineales bacterium]|nr:MAG: glycosyltransferase family 2 protein [Anaerolineales bacterium]
MAKVTFGMLALNAMPFLEYNLRALYPFAHQIIVVEGAARAASALAGPDGHSTDGTLEMLQQFKEQHDPQNKLIVISAADAGFADGFWPEKDEMAQTFAARATGDWLWQVDSDEFYLEGDLVALLATLSESPKISGISFPYFEFFGSFESYITGEWHLYQYPKVPRVFQWRPGYRYASHRPATVVNEHGHDLRSLNWLDAPAPSGRPMVMHHYSYVFPKQAEQKVGYYSNVNWSEAFKANKKWKEEQFERLRSPMRLGELGGLQWLERFEGQHPAAIEALREDIRQGRVQIEQRPADDIERLLSSPVYRLQTGLARLFLWVYWPIRVAWKSVRARIVYLLSGRLQ